MPNVAHWFTAPPVHAYKNPEGCTHSSLHHFSSRQKRPGVFVGSDLVHDRE